MKTNLFFLRKNLNLTFLEKYTKSQFLLIKYYIKRFDTGLWKIFKNNKKTYFLHLDVLIEVILMRLKFMLKPEFLYTSGLIIELKGFNRYKDVDPEAKDLDLKLKIALRENVDLKSFMEKINSHLILNKNVNPHTEQYYFTRIIVKVFVTKDPSIKNEHECLKNFSTSEKMSELFRDEFILSLLNQQNVVSKSKEK